MSDQDFEQWAIVELFGHQRMAGLVKNAQIGGCSFVRVDVPETKRAPARTKMYGSGAIYGIEFVTEETARLAAEEYGPAPMSVWDIRDAMERQKLLDTPESHDALDEPDDEW